MTTKEALEPCPKCRDCWALYRSGKDDEEVTCGRCGFNAPYATWQSRHPIPVRYLSELGDSRVSAPIVAPVVDQQCIKCGHSSDWLKHGELTANGQPTCGHGRSYNDPCGCKCEFSTPLIVPCRCSAAPEIKWQFPDDHCPEGFWEARCPNCPEGKYYGFTRTAVIERWNNEQIGVEPYPFGRIGKQVDYVAPHACVKCKHFGETDPRGRCLSVHYDAGGSLCYCGCKCEFVSSSQADDLVDEVQRRMDQVVETAVEWRQAGQAGGDWFEAAEKLGAAINSLLELRGDPNNMPRRWCSVHNCEEFKYESLEHELHARRSGECFCGVDLEAGVCPNGHDPIKVATTPPSTLARKAAVDEIVKGWFWHLPERDQERARMNIEQIIERCLSGGGEGNRVEGEENER